MRHDGCVGNGVAVAEPDVDVAEALRRLHVAWVDREAAEARWKEARDTLARHDRRVAEAEIDYERACRG